MTQSHRFHSIDIVKGILILFMLFINDLFLPDLPPWLSNIDPSNNSPGIAGWIFPAFIFMFGTTVPFAISKKIYNGLTSYDISRQIFARAIILITIGVLMVNSYRVDPELTGFSKHLWSLLVFIAVFLVWNRYPEKENNFFTVTSLRLAGLATLVFLVLKFKSGSHENNGSLITGWWDLPGLLGWGYLVSAFTFLALRNSIAGTGLIWLLFLTLNILGELNLLQPLDPVRPYLGVITDGHIPLIMLSGHLAGLILKRFSETEYRKILLILICMGLMMVLSGFSLRKWIFTAGVSGNPAIALICCGLILLFLVLMYWFADIKKNDRWFVLLKPAGENPLTVYIAPGIIYNLIYLSGLPVLFYQTSANIFINIAGSAIWAIFLVWLTSLLIRLNIKLKI